MISDGLIRVYGVWRAASHLCIVALRKQELFTSLGIRHHTFSLLSSTQQRHRWWTIINRASLGWIRTIYSAAEVHLHILYAMRTFTLTRAHISGYTVRRGSEVSQGVALGLLWLYKRPVQHPSTVWQAGPMMGPQQSWVADLAKLAQEQTAGL